MTCGMTGLSFFFRSLQRNRRRAISALPALMLPLLFTACAGISPPAATPLPAQQAASIQQYHESIELSGRLSVRYQRDGKEEATHGGFAWVQNPEHTTVTMLSPLGQTLAIIDVTPNAATLTQDGQTTRVAADVDTLANETFGWPLPVAGLRDWLQGFALDAAGQRFIATPQADDVTTRDGWRIRYASWQNDNATAAQNRPKRIDLERSAAHADGVSIRIVIDTWQAH